jgi:plasmid stabilization system protein ParE
MPTLKILAEAAEEAEAAADWYEREQPGLSRQFRDALNAGLDLLEQGVVTGSALPGPSGNEGIRHLVLRRFPYDIIFVSHHNSITVLAFAHHSRRPGYWRDRSQR